MLTANFTQLPNEIVDIKMPGLTDTLRYTLIVLGRETIGKAYCRGGSPYDFFPIPWSRWMELLMVQDRNTVRARLARLEEMGLIEVRPGDRGAWGTTSNAYRLRWLNDGRAVPCTFKAVSERRTRAMDRKREARSGDGQQPGAPGGEPAHPPLTPGGEPAHPPLTPGGAPAHPPRRTPPGGVAAHPPSFKQEMYKITKERTPSVSPSFVEVPEPIEDLTDRLTDGLTHELSELDAPWKPWLKGEASGNGWPEPLVKALEGLLDPPQVAGIAERSPWGGEGAWAILQAIRARGRNLGNPAGALWNGLMKTEKGAPWLAMAGPVLRKAGWRMLPEDDTPEADYLRVIRARHLAELGYQRLPLCGEGLEKHRSLKAARHRQTLALEEGGPPGEEESSMQPPCEQETPRIRETVPIRPEDLASEIKVRLRMLIDAQRDAFRSACRAPAFKRDELLATSAGCWEAICNLLEPSLPVEVTLPGDYRPRAIRQRGQIKAGVLNAIYEAISGDGERSSPPFPATNF